MYLIFTITITIVLTLVLFILTFINKKKMSKLKKNEDRERKIKLCIEAFNNKMSYSEAALSYNIPKTTIFCKLKGINGCWCW